MLSLRLSVAQRLCRPLPPLAAQRLRSLLYPMQRAYQDARQVSVRALTGSHLVTCTADFHGYPFAVHGYYEWRNWAIARALCRPGDTIVEVGANVGTETVGFSDIVGPTGRVHAFEPLPANVETLTRALAHIRYRNVAIHPCAVAASNCTMSFVPPPTKEASGVGYLCLQGATSVPQTVQVNCVTLDSLEPVLGGLRAIFVDVEGAELAVLQGARSVLAASRAAVVLEASPALQRRAGHSVGDLYSEVLALGYEVWEISRFTLRRADPQRCLKSHNWLCLHTSQRHLAGRVHRYVLAAGLLPCVPGLGNPLCRGRVV